MHTLIRLAVVGMAFCGLAGAAQAQPVRYVIDQKQAEVLFSYSLTLSSGVGRFTSMTGTATSTTPPSIRRRSRRSSIRARCGRTSPWRKASCAGPTSSMSPVYPQMLFKSRSVRPKNATTGEMIGDITVKGITRPIVLHVTLQPRGPGGTRQFIGKTRINRNDFNMTAYAFLVGDTVDIEIRALLRPQ